MVQKSPAWIDVTTQKNASVSRVVNDLEIPGLTILCHPDPSRVGDQAPLPGLLSAGGEELSRLYPLFAPPTGGEPRPLMDSHISRRPLRLTPADSSLCLSRAGSSTPLVVNGSPAATLHHIPRTDLKAGVVLLLNRRVVLLLHMHRPVSRRPPSFNLIGESAAMLNLRKEIEKLADFAHPVLVRGESGTGKELVARALHDAGPQRSGPYISTNAGRLRADLSEAALFGAVKGSYSGADRSRDGHFQRADGGSLFFDEIGEIPTEVQVQLLRVLEDRTVRRIGEKRSRKVNVRLIFATNADLETAITDGVFREDLYHRIASSELTLPPLRSRRDDLGRLLFHFLREELQEVGEADRLASPQFGPNPWLPADLVARLALFSWPGNVRELRNVARQLVVAGRGENEIRITGKLERQLRGVARPQRLEPCFAPGEVSIEDRRPAYRRPEEISETELVEALRKSHWNVRVAAGNLNVARPSLYKLMDRCPRVRKASELSREEIIEASKHSEGRLDRMVNLLEVSKRGLKLRMTKLGL